MKTSTFLTAEWRKLAMANYIVEPAILENYLPCGTELDYFNDKCYVSLVGFMFLNTKLKGIPVPFHRNFEEVNLRFYVRYKEANTWKRGVVFIKEIVPKPALTLVANTIYKEKYSTLPMKHSWYVRDDELTVQYAWKQRIWNSISVTTASHALPIDEGSEEEFITEHYWGYTRLADKLTSQYEVQHPRWNAFPVKNYKIEVDFEDVYGPEFGFLQNQKPVSVMLAEGSTISVNSGIKIKIQ